MQAPGGRVPLGRPGRLAVDGDRHQPGRLARRRHPPAERPGERPRVELGEDPLEGVGAGDAVVQREEAAEERLLGPAVLGDRLPRLGPADDGAGGDGQDVGQRGGACSAVSRRGSGRSAKTAVSGSGGMRGASWSPRYSRKPLRRQQFIVR